MAKRSLTLPKLRCRRLPLGSMMRSSERERREREEERERCGEREPTRRGRTVGERQLWQCAGDESATTAMPGGDEACRGVIKEVHAHGGPYHGETLSLHWRAGCWPGVGPRRQVHCTYMHGVAPYNASPVATTARRSRAGSACHPIDWRRGDGRVGCWT